MCCFPKKNVFFRWNLDFYASLRSLRSDSTEKMNEKYMSPFKSIGESILLIFDGFDGF